MSAYSFDEYQAIRQFRLLDGLRCISILAVLWHHSPGAELFPSLSHRGYLGVDLFFVISGFLITTLLLREQDTKGTISIKNFYVRRTLRIFPIYYTYLALLLIWYTVRSHPNLDWYIQYLPYYVSYTTNWIPIGEDHPFERAWSLAVEEQFYLIWPALLLSLTNRNVLMVFAATFVIVSVPVSSWALAHEINPYWGNMVPFRTILMGCVLAILMHRRPTYEFIARLCGHHYTALVVAIAICILIAIPGRIVGLWGFALHLLMAALVATSLINDRNILAPIFTARIVVLIGTISYGIYVFHSQLYIFVNAVLVLLPEPLQDSKVLFFLLLTAFSTIVGYLSYEFYEKRFLKLKEKFSA